MSPARLRLALAFLLFAGWLGWLGYAVTQRGTVPLVSRGQVTGASHLVVADVAADPAGLPGIAATVRQVLRGDGPKAGEPIDVLNLPSARPPTGPFPGPGEYLLALTTDGRSYRVAGLPASPGYDPATASRPVVYPWTADVQRQLAALGVGE